MNSVLCACFFLFFLRLILARWKTQYSIKIFIYFQMSVDSQKLDPNQRQQIMSSVQQQLALQNAQELLQVRVHCANEIKLSFSSKKLSDKCFKACVQKPGSSLSSSEQVCSICSH